MIEIIFVIVILGVLAAVALARLAITRDDAEITKTISSITLAVRDSISYYTAKGYFANAPQNMTNVVLTRSDGKPIPPDTSATANAPLTTSKYVYAPYKKKVCVALEFKGDQAAIRIARSTQSDATAADKDGCNVVLNYPSIKALIDSMYIDENGYKQSGFKVGGSSGIDFGNTN